MKRLTALLALVLLLAACAGTVSLYPANDRASEMGNRIITMNYQEQLGSRGAVSVTMPDGETFQGEFNVLQSGQIGFGSIYGSVYGPRGTVTGLATGTSFSLNIQKPFAVTMLGNRGSRMQCEGYVASYHGTGACEHSNGAVFRMHF